MNQSIIIKILANCLHQNKITTNIFIKCIEVLSKLNPNFDNIFTFSTIQQQKPSIISLKMEYTNCIFDLNVLLDNENVIFDFSNRNKTLTFIIKENIILLRRYDFKDGYVSELTFKGELFNWLCII